MLESKLEQAWAEAANSGEIEIAKEFSDEAKEAVERAKAYASVYGHAALLGGTLSDPL